MKRLTGRLSLVLFACLFLVSCFLLGRVSSASAEDEAGKRITAIGSDSMGSLMRRLAEAFRKQQPQVAMQVVSRGSATAPAALIEGSADLGPMNRPMKATELKEFRSKYGFEPTQVRTAIAAVGIYVAAENPLDKITFAQLDSIFSASRKRAGETVVTKWEQLGVKGKFSGEEIVAIGLEAESQAASAFRQQVMLQGEFSDRLLVTTDSRSLAEALRVNKSGIAFGDLTAESNSEMKSLKRLQVGKDDLSHAVKPTEANVRSGEYPLARFLNIYIVRTPGEPLETSLKTFLSFVLSPAGQEIVRREELIPLPTAVAQEELSKLE